MRRFLRGLLWGGLLGAMLAMYLGQGSGTLKEDGDVYRFRRLRRAALGEAAEQALRASRASRLQLALDAGRAAMDATLALLGRKV
ncbi:MAG TPA: hypothetical protein VIK73_01735 [Limnochordales bacterium]